MYVVAVCLIAAGPSPADPVPQPRPSVVVVAPVPGPAPLPPPAPAPGPTTGTLALDHGRFEMLAVNGYAGKVAWRVPPGSPVEIYRLRPGSRVLAVPPAVARPRELPAAGPGPAITVLVVGLKAGADGGGSYDVGDLPGVLVYPVPGRSGQARLEALGVDPEGYPVQLAEVLVTVGPRPPPGPGPAPGPSPDGTSPFPATVAGLHVLMVFDPANTTRPAAQNSVLYGRAVVDYLRSKTAKEAGPEPGTDGRAYRIYPSNSDASRAPKVWADALSLALRSGKDWILIGDGRTGYSGPLPATEAEALALLKKYGGE